MSQPTQPTEAEIRSELGIPPIGDPRAQRVIILSQSAHLDWDWLLPFSTLLENVPADTTGYFSDSVQPVADIFTQAANMLCPNGVPNAQYYYSICEMGFFQSFAADNPAVLQLLKAAGNNLRIVGGGITSPDNLLPHGECFIRIYLLGKRWLDATLPALPLRQCWLPDDFGHDSQLPILLEALGFQGVGFSRIPPAASQQLTTSGVDFIWQAADGSTTIAHWMQGGYCQGDCIDGQGDCPDYTHPVDMIKSYYEQNQQASPTDYVFVPVGCDFRMPQDLPTFAVAYNADPLAGVYAVAASFDHYVGLVSGYWQRQQAPSPMPFYPTPYWTGFYASRPANKILHQAATRALLGAEVFGKIADVLQADAPAWQPVVNARNQAIANGWAALAPSTHHDYITGTAVDAVYTGEQLPLLRSAATIATSARAIAINELATLIGATPNSGERPVAIFNQLGYARSGLVELPLTPDFSAVSVRTASGTGPVQPTEDGKLLFMAAAPSLGYDTAYLSTQNPAAPPAQTMALSYTASGDTFTLTNYYLTATITKAALWGLASLKDLTQGSGVELLAQDHVGNFLLFYTDAGGIYQFGNETGGTLALDPNGQIAALGATLVETGPLRLRLRTSIEFSSTDSSGAAISGTYTRDYTLVAGEPFLRMSVSGAAPLTASGLPTVDNPWSGNPYAVMVKFSFADPGSSNPAIIDQLSYGSTYHWTAQQPGQPWSPPIFQATHDFLLPQAGGSALPAVYHASIPAWAIDADGSLIGCVLRNAPNNDNHGAAGGDHGTHTHNYALRIPGTGTSYAIQDPATGAQLYESLQFQTPLLGAYVNVPTGDSGHPEEISFPATFSLAAVTSGDAIITSAKAAVADDSNLVLRIYQPTNTAIPITVSLSDYAQALNQPLSACLVTALETDIAGQSALPITDGTVSFTAARALTTLLVTDATNS